MRALPRWRDDHRPFPDLVGRERAWVLVVRLALAPVIALSLLLLIWVLPLPLLVLACKVSLDAAGLAHGDVVRGWWLELTCHLVVLGGGSWLLYTLVTDVSRVGPVTGLAWCAGVVIVVAFARTAQIAEVRRGATGAAVSQAAG